MSTDTQHMEFTDDERCRHAGLNASGFSLGLLRYARAPMASEAEAVHAVIVASDVAEFGESGGHTLADLQDQWGNLDLDHDAWVVTGPEGTVVGYAFIRTWRRSRMDVEGYIHPDHFSRGIGTSLIRLSEERAREHLTLAPSSARVVVNNSINALNTDACALLEREGYCPVRYFFRMEADLDEPPPSPLWPETIDVQPFISGKHEHVFYETLEEAMADHWGHVPVPFETWKKKHAGASVDPGLWVLAMEGNEPAGAAICSISEGIGWLDILGVRAPWRRRGLGMALLQYAAGIFHQRGLQRIALDVDAASPTGATRLYERVGMHVVQQHATYSKELRPGDA